MWPSVQIINLINVEIRDRPLFFFFDGVGYGDWAISEDIKFFSHLLVVHDFFGRQ